MDKYSVLIVDDSPVNLVTISNYLKKSEFLFTLYKAPNGKVACMLAEEKLPDLIIMDWEMPEMNGIEATKYLKSLESTKDIPVIMATGVMTSPKHLKTALEAGAVDYIRKPIDKTELTARVYSILKLAESYKKIKLLNATKDKFFSIVAHDLKNPLHALMGLSDLLLKNHASYDDQKREIFIKSINDSSTKTYKLLKNLLTWANSQSGNIDFSPEKINVKKLIDEIISLLIETSAGKNINMLNSAEKDTFVFADRNMLELIFRNLVTNAIKFTPKGGEISLKSRLISDEFNQEYVEITVKDSGVGISPEIQTKLFNITENNSTLGTEKETGTVLGLLLCKDFIEKHNGEIWVESEVDKGSKFIFTIKSK